MLFGEQCVRRGTSRNTVTSIEGSRGTSEDVGGQLNRTSQTSSGRRTVRTEDFYICDERDANGTLIKLRKEKQEMTNAEYLHTEGLAEEDQTGSANRNSTSRDCSVQGCIGDGTENEERPQYSGSDLLIQNSITGRMEQRSG